MMIYTIVSKYLLQRYSHERIMFFFTRSNSSNLDDQMAKDYIKSLWTSCNFGLPMPETYYAFEKEDPATVQKAPEWLIDQLN